MRTVSWLAALVWVLAAPGGYAQRTPPGVAAETQTFSGLHTVIFRLPEGAIRAVFPDDLAAGDIVSGTILPSPTGTTPASKQTNAGELNGYVLDFEGQKTPVPDKIFRWKVPPTLGGGTAQMVLRNAKGDPVAQSSIPVGVRVRAGGRPDFDLPTTGTADGVASARGPFDGDFRSTAVSVGGARAALLAESPRKIVFQPPAGRPGVSTLEIKKGSLTASAPFRTIAVLLSATRTNLAKGQTATLTVTVQGLQGLTEPADLILLNRSPKAVSVQGGAEQRLAIDPKQVRPGGTYVLTRTVTGILASGFDITVIAARPPTLQFDLGRAVDRAVVDWQESTGVPITDDARHLIATSVINGRKPLDDFLRMQEAYRGDPVSITDMLVRNYCFDLRDHRQPGAAGLGGGRGDAMAFLPQAAAIPKVAIDAQDVNGFGFTRFLSQLLGRLSTNQPVGYLTVVSRPDQAPISVDGRQGPDRTNRKFLVSAGTHSVVVTLQSGACQKSIEVQPFQTGTVACL